MQFPPSDTIRANTASAIMSLELPFLANVDAEKLMKVRTEEGHAFQNFRTELDKQLRDLRSINDPEQASRKAKDAVHELTMVQIRDITNKLESLKEKLWFKAAMGTVGLLAAVQTSGASLLGLRWRRRRKGHLERRASPLHRSRGRVRCTRPPARPSGRSAAAHT